MQGRLKVIKSMLIGLTLLGFPAAAMASSESISSAGTAMTHRMMMLAIQLGLIIFIAKIGSILFERIKLPGTLGELMAGMLIGPYALGKLGFYGFPNGLFAADAGGAFIISPELYGLAAVASIVLLFNVGLETDLKLLLRYSLAGGLAGLGGLVTSFFGGIVATAFLSRVLLGEDVSLLAPQCLLLGTILTATSVGITARILSERRKLDSPEGVTILSAAVIDDVMGIILLAVVMGVVTASKQAGGVDWARISIIGLKAVGVWLAASAIGLVAARKISFLLKWFGDRTSIAIMALGLALILAGLFEEAGLAMIIGAYVMGVSLSQADISHVIQEKLRPIYALLIPVFFCVIGMQIDLSALRSVPVLLFGLGYAIVALATKVIGCGVPVLFANFNLRGAVRIGFGMAPRCEVALIIAGIGLSAGMLNAQLFAAVIIMVAVSTIVAPPALVALFKSPARGTRKPVPADKDQTNVDFEFPNVEMTDFFIGKLTEVFDGEGFFVHLIDRERRLFQFRKDLTVIDLRQLGQIMTFTCKFEDVNLVNAAMHEALAALEQAVRGLKKPLDSKAIRSRMQEAAPVAQQGLDLGDYLSIGLIEPNLKGSDKAQVIDELVGVLVRDGLLSDKQAGLDAVWDRERSMSTGLQYGVAIPHGKTDAVDKLICAVGIKKAGVDFDAMDDEPSKIFILTLSPKAKPAPHVQFMSTISQALNSAGRERILEASNAHNILQVFISPVIVEPARPAAPARFVAGEYIKADLLQPNLQGNTGHEIICELLDLLSEADLLRDPQAAAQVVLAREAQMSTGMEAGVAVPHGRTDAVDGLVCAIGIKRDGIDFGAADGKPSQIFILVLTPEAGADPYLQFVASLMGLLTPAGREKILAANTADELFKALTQ